MQLALKFRHMLPETVRQELDNLVVGINAMWEVGHNPDGTHKSVTEQGRASAMGEWMAAPFDASTFSSNVGANWTVETADVNTLAYTLVGKTMTLAFTLINTSVGAGATTELRITLPAGVRGGAIGQTRAGAQITDVTSQAGFCYTQPGRTYLGIQKITGAAFTASAVDAITVTGSITFPVQG